MILIVILVILIIFYLYEIKLDKFNIFPYNPKFDSPQTNYDDIIKKINSQQQYKKNLSVALNPIPTIQCQLLDDQDNCNKYGCNWFGSYCSSMYPYKF